MKRGEGNTNSPEFSLLAFIVPFLGHHSQQHSWGPHFFYNWAILDLVIVLKV